MRTHTYVEHALRDKARLARRYNELRYRMIECAVDPDHPATRANRDRWTREFRRVEAACKRQGMLA